MHAGAAMRLQAPAFMLTDDQAEQLTRAAAEVAKHYDIAMLDPKWMSWIALGGVAAKIYGPMALSYWGERHATIAAPPAQPAPNGALASGPPPVMPQPFNTGAVGNA